MADQLLTPGWYLQPAIWPYGIPNGLAAFSTPGNDPSVQNSPWPAANGGILGPLGRASAGSARSRFSESRSPASGGILGALTAPPESPTPSIPYWLQSAMPFGLQFGALLPPSDARPPTVSPATWDSPARSDPSAFPFADCDSSTPDWLRTALPSGANSNVFGVPRSPAEEPSNPAPQLWPVAARDVPTPPMPPALLPRFSSVPLSEGNASLWQTPTGSNAEALASPELDSVFAHDFPAPGLSLTPHSGRQLDDMLTKDWQPDRPAAPGAEHLAVSDTWPLVSSASPTDQRRMSGDIGAESEARVVSDVTPDDNWRPGARYAQNAPPPRPPRQRLSVPIRIGDRWIFELESGQANRLFEAQTRAEKTTARVREIDPKWRPRPSAYESVEGLIRAYASDAEQAQARLRELTAPLTPLIPRERPATASDRNDIARATARWLVQNREHVIEGADWFSEYEPSVRAYLDPARMLLELQQAVSAPKPGYDIHHIVEKDAAKQDGFSPLVINAPDHLVQIPRFKHWEITGWYMTKNNAYKGLSPRDYLRDKTWAERVGVGLDALILHGVLKP
jgi:hypothetical protein